MIKGFKDKFSVLKRQISEIKEKKQRELLQNELEELKDLSVFAGEITNIASQKVKIEISSGTVARTMVVILLVALLAFFLFQITNILILFFIAFFVAAALDPFIDLLQKGRIPRAIGVLFVYLLLFILIGMLISQLLPLVAKQLVDIAKVIGDFFAALPHYDAAQLPFSEQLRPYIEKLYSVIDFKTVALQVQSSLQLVSSQLLNLGGNLWTAIQIISNGLMNTLIVLVLVFFMAVDQHAVENFCLAIFPTKYSPYISKRMTIVKEKIGHWIRGQFFVSLVAAILTFIGLSIFGVEYALTISVIAGIMMVIPVFGRVFAWIISLPIVLNQSPILAIWLSIYYLLLSQVENNILVPYLMNKAVGLNPIIIIFSLMVGFQFLGILGLVLSIPIATILAVFVKDFTRKINHITSDQELSQKV